MKLDDGKRWCGVIRHFIKIAKGHGIFRIGHFWWEWAIRSLAICHMSGILCPVITKLLLVDNSFPTCMSLTCYSQYRWLVKQRQCHVLSCLCDNACKRSLAIDCKIRTLCPVSKLLSVPIWPACVNRDVHIIPTLSLPVSSLFIQRPLYFALVKSSYCILKQYCCIAIDNSKVIY